MRVSFIHFLLLCLFLLPAAAKAGEPIGAVQEATGSATILHAGEAAPHALAAKAPLFMKDVIDAKDDAHLKMKFADETELMLSGRGKFTIDEYIYDPKAPEKNKSVFSLFGAAFSYVGGLLDKNAQSSINLDFGSIGIRGTKVMSAYAGGGNWIYLESGKITIDNAAGQVIVNPGEGTNMTSKTQAPDAPYAWSADEIAWLQHVIDDPSARSSGAMASNKSQMPLGRARAPSQMAAAEAPARAKDEMEKGKAALDEMSDKKAALQSGNEMAAAPAASPAQMPSATGGAGAGAPAAASATAAATAAAPPVVIAATPASPPVASEPMPADSREAESKVPAKAEARRDAPKDVVSLKGLSAATLGTRVTQDGKGVVRIDTQTATTINLASADVSAQHLEDTTLMFRASMKAKGLTGMAFLEMWVHFPGEKGGIYFSRGLDHPLTKEEDWKEFETPFFLKKGQMPDMVILNLAIHGRGTVWIRDVRLQK